MLEGTPLEVTKSIHWNTTESNPLKYAQNLSRKHFIVIRPKTLDWYMPEAIPVPESIQLDYARKHSTGTRQKVFHWNASQSIPLENTPKSFD